MKKEELSVDEKIRIAEIAINVGEHVKNRISEEVKKNTREKAWLLRKTPIR